MAIIIILAIVAITITTIVVVVVIIISPQNCNQRTAMVRPQHIGPAGRR